MQSELANARSVRKQGDTKVLRRRDEAPALLREWEIKYGDALAENSSTTNSLSDTGGVFLGLTGFRGRFGVSSFARGESLLVLSSYAMAHKGKMISIHALQIQECWL